MDDVRAGGESGGSKAARLRDLGSLLNLGLTYWLSLYPQVRSELDAWELRARGIPDPLLRRHALSKLTGERLNPEAAALFAMLAPRSHRRRVVRLIVAYQVLYDYLDGVNEEPGFTALYDGLQMHRALTEAVVTDVPMSDYYLHHPERRDGGYARALGATCRRIVRSLPSIVRASAILVRATERCAQAQSHNHATDPDDHSQLIDWSEAQVSDEHGYLWWELAAGGISCLSIHALLASAADPRSAPENAALLDAAYFPPICALSALLDSLADYHRDASTDNHSFIAHYRDDGHAAERLVAITADASRLIRPLQHSRRHAIILAGIVAYYISSPSVWEGFPAVAAERLTETAGSLGLVMRGVMRARRRLHDRALSAGSRTAG
jgi:tetraprenyl-beta-curcumene synthase